MAKKMYSISRRDIADAHKAAQRARDTVAQQRAKSRGMVDRVTRVGSVFGGALGSAVLQSRYGVTGIGPVPIDAAGGLGLLALSYFMGANGTTANVLEGLGEGMLASFATKWGASLGAQWRQSSGANTAPTTPQTFGTSGVGAWDAMPAYNYGYQAVTPEMAASYGYPAPQNWGATDAQVVDYFRRGVG